ncbi:MAG: NADH:flavin oxidoreductase [Armatimonadota bacterium]|nr:NADH:flavin oxidoreductase [Armatimonadota bacterium]
MSDQPLSAEPYPKVQKFRDAAALRTYLSALGVYLPLVDRVSAPADSPMGRPLRAGPLLMGNRFAIHPMEGWDATPDGRPSEDLVRRWRRFGLSGAKLIWGGEAFAVRREGRANPNQLYFHEHSLQDLTLLRETLVGAHRESFGRDDDLVVGLQLTHSGRFCRPQDKKRMEPRLAYSHPILNAKYGLAPDHPLITDNDICDIIGDYVLAAKVAQEAGFQFVDVKHCHGYLGHEFLSAFTRPGPYGGSFENRTRFLKEIVAGIRREAPGLEIGVRLSAFDFLPYKPDPVSSRPGRMGKGIPDDLPGLRPYIYGFGVDQDNPADNYDLTETYQFLQLLTDLAIVLVNITAGSPYYNPHIQRPAYFPPSDGYQPPEDPLVGVARQATVTADLKAKFPNLVLVGTAYTYLQEFLPLAAEAAVGMGRVDMVGIGRMVLSYPTLPADVLSGNGSLTHRKQICRTFSDCTTAPRGGLPSGCFPLDDHYKGSETHNQLKILKGVGKRQDG